MSSNGHASALASNRIESVINSRSTMSRIPTQKGRVRRPRKSRDESRVLILRWFMAHPRSKATAADMASRLGICYTIAESSIKGMVESGELRSEKKSNRILYGLSPAARNKKADKEIIPAQVETASVEAKPSGSIDASALLELIKTVADKPLTITIKVGQ